MLLVLAGYSATGKDTYQNALLDRNKDLKRALSATTRPIRPGEKDGREYYFLDGYEYQELQTNGEILSERTYYTIQDGLNAVWHYGLLRQDFVNENWITILDHEGANRVRNALGKDVVKIIYFQCAEEELKRRSIERKDEAAEFDRRLADDKIQFLGIEDIYDLSIRTDVPISIYEANLYAIEKFL